jgi:hypothetical protein
LTLPHLLTSGPLTSRRSTRIVALALGLALVPVIVLAIRLLAAGGAELLGDQALIALRLRDVGGGHTPLVGSYERFGGKQPRSVGRLGPGASPRRFTSTARGAARCRR